MKQNENKMLVLQNSDSPDGKQRLALEEALQQTQKKLESLRLELESTQQELVQAQALIATGMPSGVSAEQEVAIPAGGRFSRYRRIIALEQLGKQVLEKNASSGVSLQSVVEFYLAGVEKIYPGLLCSTLQLKRQNLSTVAGPSLPAGFSNAIDHISIEQAKGTFLLESSSNEKIILADLAQESKNQLLQSMAHSYGIKACWSYPVVSIGQKLLGALVVYLQEARPPSREEEKSLESVRNLLQLIMESKLAEKELRESNERFYYATLATNDAIWDFDIHTGTIAWGLGFEKLFGFKVQEFGLEFDLWAQQVHPEDLDRVNASLEEVITHATKDFWREEYRFMKANGEYAYVVDQGSLIRDEAGKPVRIVGAMQDITAQKQAEEELRKLSVIARETVNGVLIMSPDLRVHWVNPAFTKMLGYTLEEIAGKTLASFLNGSETDLGTLANIEERLSKVQPLECNVLQYSKTKEKHWIKLQVQPLLDEHGQVESVFALLTDITQQKAEEQQLRLLESVITNSQDAIIISEVLPDDLNTLKAIYFNNAFFSMTGYTQEEVLGRDPSFLNGPDTDTQVMEGIIGQMRQGKACEGELMSYRKDGSRFWTQLLLIPMFNHRGQLTHWISLLRDITLRKSYAQERELLISELTQNNADLKQFTFITSHNLRAPLSNLTGIINLLDMDAVPEGRNKLLIQKFKESTVQLNTIIDDLLEILVIKNKPHTQKEQINLPEAFERVRLSVDGLLTEIGADVLTDFAQVPEVYYNGSYLYSILLNLLSNAIKYRSPDQILSIEVTTETIDGRQYLHFKDNGLGIDLNRYGERIFGLYQRFHQRKDSKGMGLYIAHSQAKAMGGNLSVVSEVGLGTTFTLQF
ncbi:PAS domain-containing sensor histidine kinase [Rufibacter soli]